MRRKLSAASIVDIYSPISAIREDTLACAVGNDTIAKRLVGEAPSMKPTVTVDPVSIKARVIHFFLTTSERRGEIALGKKRGRADQNLACSQNGYHKADIHTAAPPNGPGSNEHYPVGRNAKLGYRRNKVVKADFGLPLES